MINGWIKTPPATPKSQKFTCPYCGRYCTDIFYDENKHTRCTYRFCPYCGKEVIKRERKKHIPLCLARVFAYEVGVDLACEDCPVECEEKRERNAK